MPQKSKDIQQDNYVEYIRLIRAGVPREQAFAQAYPEGVVTKEDAILDAQEEAAKKADKSQLAGTAGAITGMLGTKLISDQISGSGAFSNLFGGGKEGGGLFSNLFGGGSSGAPAAGGWEQGALEMSGLTPDAAAPLAEAGPGMGAYAAPAAATLAAIYGLKQGAFDGYNSGQGKNVKDALSYQMSKPSSWVTPAASITGTVAGSLFGSGKDQDQQDRDAIRASMVESGFLDPDYNVSLADGQKFDIGRDGSEQLYNFDASAPDAGRDLNLVAPLAKILTGGDEKLGSDFSGYLTNAVRSTGDPLANAKELYAKAGITSWEQGRQALQELKDAGSISDQELAVYDQGLANIFGGVPLAKSQRGEQQLGSSLGKEQLVSAMSPQPVARM